MSKHKKKKQPPPVNRCYKVTKTYFDEFSKVARKILHLSGIDPAQFDTFTKKHKQDMMLLKGYPPRVIAQKGQHVPPAHIRMLQNALTRYMKETPVAPDADGLCYYDYVTKGQLFISYLGQLENKPEVNITASHLQIARTVLDAVENTEVPGHHLLLPLFQYVRLMLAGLSKVNFRIYTHRYDWVPAANPVCLIPTFYIHKTPVVTSKIFYGKYIHKVFRVSMGKLLVEEPEHLEVAGTSLFGEGAGEKKYKVYIQGHALHRMAERLDSFSPFIRNLALYVSILLCDIQRSTTGQYLLSCNDTKGNRAGYFPFVVIDDSLLILSFLPLSSPDVPEGNHLHTLLHTTKDDVSFLGMDKLSFYQKTDFDTVPILKTALQQAGMWHLAATPEVETDILRQKNQTGIVARFFRQVPLSDNPGILDEIAAKE